MAQGKQAKVLTEKQQQTVLNYLERATRHPQRNKAIFLLSTKAGLRAKEIVSLRWRNVCDVEGQVAEELTIEDIGSKGKGGRTIPLNPKLREALRAYHSHLLMSQPLLYDWRYRKLQPRKGSSDEPYELDMERPLIQTERSGGSPVSAQVIVNLFQEWFKALGLTGASSHSGRRTFITNAAKKISTVGGSLRDVQQLAGHTSLQTTQAYIEGSTEAKQRIVKIV